MAEMKNLEKGYQTSIMELQDDNLFDILKRVETEEERNSFGLTCRRWFEIHNVSRQSLDLKSSIVSSCSISLPRRPFVANSFHVVKIVSRFPNLKSVSLSGCTMLTNLGVACLQSIGSTIEKLNLDCCFLISDDGIEIMASGCSGLKSISLYKCHITDISVESLATSCPALEDVNLSHCKDITDHGIHFLSQRCRQLREVNISHCRKVYGDGFSGCSETLAIVEAESCNLEPDGIANIVSGGGLKSLNLAALSWCILGNGLLKIGMGFTKNLQVLNFRSCRAATDEVVIMISKGSPLLKEWNLALCHNVLFSGWRAISNNCHNLEILHVNRCLNFNDDVLNVLSTGCRRLALLRMSRCSWITNEAISSFISRRAEVEIWD